MAEATAVADATGMAVPVGAADPTGVPVAVGACVEATVNVGVGVAVLVGVFVEEGVGGTRRASAGVCPPASRMVNGRARARAAVLSHRFSLSSRIDGCSDSPAALDPAPNARLVAPVLLAEPSLQIAFLAVDHPTPHHYKDARQQYGRPERIRDDGHPGVQEREREIDRIAGEALWPCGHDRRRGFARIGRYTGAP